MTPKAALSKRELLGWRYLNPGMLTLMSWPTLRAMLEFKTSRWPWRKREKGRESEREKERRRERLKERERDRERE
jgi:hypothetical protein